MVLAQQNRQWAAFDAAGPVEPERNPGFVVGEQQQARGIQEYQAVVNRTDHFIHVVASGLPSIVLRMDFAREPVEPLGQSAQFILGFLEIFLGRESRPRNGDRPHLSKYQPAQRGSRQQSETYVR